MTVETLPDRPPSLSMPNRGGARYEFDGICMDLHPLGVCECYFISPKEVLGFPVGRKPTRVVSAFDTDVVTTETIMPDTMGFRFRGSKIYARVCEGQENAGEIFVVYYDPSLRMAIEQEMPNRKVTPYMGYNFPIPPATKILFQSIVRFMRNGFQGGKLVAESLVSMAIVRALEIFDAQQSGKAVIASALNKRRLDRTLEFIEANLERNIGLREVAEAAEVGLYNLSRHFPKAVGEPPHAYLTRQRLERAKEMLANTDKPMSEIAHRCGFSSPSYLSTAFKRGTGLTPSRYRVEARR